MQDIATGLAALAGGQTAQMTCMADTGGKMGTLLFEAQKHTALLTEIRDTLKRGLLVKTVVAL